MQVQSLKICHSQVKMRNKCSYVQPIVHMLYATISYFHVPEKYVYVHCAKSMKFGAWKPDCPSQR